MLFGTFRYQWAILEILCIKSIQIPNFLVWVEHSLNGLFGSEDIFVQRTMSWTFFFRRRFTQEKVGLTSSLHQIEWISKIRSTSKQRFTPDEINVSEDFWCLLLRSSSSHFVINNRLIAFRFFISFQLHHSVHTFNVLLWHSIVKVTSNVSAGFDISFSSRS